jgi:hypothetical protein
LAHSHFQGSAGPDIFLCEQSMGLLTEAAPLAQPNINVEKYLSQGWSGPCNVKESLHRSHNDSIQQNRNHFIEDPRKMMSLA